MLGSTNVAGKLNELLSISLNGTMSITYDGQLEKSLNITASSIGAATSGHNHDTTYSKIGHIHTKAEINLGNVDNTTDATKDVNSSRYIRGIYTGGGGKQPPSYIPSGRVGFNMTDDFGSYADLIFMDTYSGGDVPYVSALGVTKESNPSVVMMSGPKNGSSWNIKRYIAQFTNAPSNGKFVSTNGSSGQIIDSGYSASNFASSSHNHAGIYSDISHMHTTLKSNTDQRNVGTIPNDYNGVFKLSGLKSISAAGNPPSAVGTYLNLIGSRAWNDPSGGNSTEFALGSSNQVFVRSGDSGSWNPWVTISCLNSQAVTVQSDSPYSGTLWAW